MVNGKNSKDRPRVPLKTVLKDGARGLREWRFFYPATMGITLLILSVTVAVLINPAATSPALPVREQDIGTKALEEIKTPTGFSVTDVEATERKRGEAEEAILSVYDFDVELGEERTRRLKEAFAEMAREIHEYEVAVKELEGEGQAGPGHKPKAGRKEVGKRKVQPSKEPGTGRAPTGGKPETEPEPLEDSLDARLEARKDQFVRTLQVVISEPDFNRLKSDRYSSKTLAAVVGLVLDTMGRMIVSNRELLAAERDRGITVRVFREGVPYEEHEVRSLSKILDFEGAQLRVERNAALELRDMPGPLRSTQIRLAKSLVVPNLTFNRAETERRKKQAHEAVKPLKTFIEKDTVIIHREEVIDKTHLSIFREMKRRTGDSSPLEIALGTVLIVILMLVITTRFSARNIRAFRTQPKDLVLLGLVLFLFVVSTKIWFWIFGAVWDRFQIFPLESYYYAIPFAAGAMLVRFVLNSEMSLAFTAVASILAGLLMENSIGYTIYCLVSSMVAAWAVASAKQRTSLLKAGAVTGLANVALAVGLSLFSGAFWAFETLFNAIFAFSGGILAAMIVTASAPVIEVLFGYTTDIKLLELANLNHPLLKDLIVQAPGSYHHSIIVGSLVEAAAEAINCNPLLARVQAYYHDIGKVKSPSYFSENQRDSHNPHDKLKASLSATVLKIHVKDGAELARASRLGEPIVDAILQHHGMSLIKFFYQKAKDQEDPENPVTEEEFRYPGPKPQTREVALVMLADSVEAAAKSVSEPSPARLQGLVQNLINRAFVDGQLDECDLTLKDLHEIARAFNRVLSGIYHHRPDYPESATKERETGERKGKATDPKLPAGKKEGAEKREEDLKRLGM